MSFFVSSRGEAIPYGAAPRVNLLPSSERDRRERARAVRGWAAGAVVAVLLVAAAVAGTLALQLRAESRLEAERDHTDQLTTELARYGDVAKAQGTVERYESGLQQAMRTDVVWTPIYRELTARMPSGVTLTGFAAVVQDATASPAEPAEPAATDDPEAQPLPRGTAVGVSLTVSTKDPLAAVRMSRSFNGIDGVIDVDVLPLDSAEGTYSYAARVAFSESAYSHRFAGEGG